MPYVLKLKPETRGGMAFTHVEAWTGTGNAQTDYIAARLLIQHSFLQCCGAVGIQSFYNTRILLEDIPAFFALLHKAIIGEGSKNGPSMFFIVNEGQMKEPLVKLLIECGATEALQFENETHSSTKLRMFHFSLRKVWHKYITPYGVAIYPNVGIEKAVEVVRDAMGRFAKQEKEIAA